MEKLYLGTNTKMYKTIRDTCQFLERLDTLTQNVPAGVELFVIPSFTSLDRAGQLLKNSRIRLGAQNMCWENEGQFTGEISPPMLRETGVQIVEIGHSERRHIFGETDQEENRKVKTALREGFTALLCVGETGEEKDDGISDEVLRVQLKRGLAGVPPGTGRLWIAYEPVWAIGVGGVPASREYAREKHGVIRETLREIFGESGNDVPILYGGSVNPQNACGLIEMENIDGLFIGRSAWDADNFAAIIRSVCKTVGLCET